MTKKRLLTIILSIIIIFRISLSSIAIDSQPFGEDSIRVGGDNNYPPYEFIDDSGNFKGFNVDIIRAIGIELGLEIELVPSSWEDTMNLLILEEIDAIQGMTITPHRIKEHDFTEPIVTNSQNIFVLNSTSYISDINDLEGKRVAIQAVDVTSEILRNVNDITIIEKENQLEALRSLLSGEVDAFIGNRLTGTYYVQRFDLTETVKIVGDPIYTTTYSIAVKSGNKELLDLLNLGLEKIKANGTYDKIYKKWFGETIIDIYIKWKRLLYISLSALFVSLVIILLSYLWNKKLHDEVEVRTNEIVELNKLATHNDKMQSLGRLSAGLAHELRNPLTSIKTFVDLIPLKIEDENFRNELIRIVPNEIKRLNDLIGSLLDYSKPQSSNPELLILDDVLSQVLTLLKQSIQEKKVKVITNNLDISLYADESQIKQILINIILNSLEAMDNEGRLEIKGEVVSNQALVSIKDNGSGVPTEMLNKLFDPFYTSKKTGYGIGLSVTDRLINENNGQIKLTSEPGEGTIVTIYMPMHPVNREEN